MHNAPRTVEIVEGLAPAAAMLKPLRLEILEKLATPASATGLAKELGMPRQRLNYHLRELERAGLLELAEERRRGNCTERLYRATARKYVIGPEALGTLAPTDSTEEREAGALRERFSWAFLVTLLGRALKNLAILRRRADRANQRLATFGLETSVRFRSPTALNDFARDLSAEVARLAAQYQDDKTPEGRSYELFLGTYPTITRPVASDDTDERNQP